jgi:fructosamine-3-kinase
MTSAAEIHYAERMRWLLDVPVTRLGVAGAQHGCQHLTAGLARLHAAGADAFGAPWPGFIASLPLDNTPGEEWGEWYAEQRLVPYLRKASDNGSLSPADISLVESVAARIGELAGPPEPPSRTAPPRAR